VFVSTVSTAPTIMVWAPRLLALTRKERTGLAERWTMTKAVLSMRLSG
jgi:hypothetical protein